VETVNSDNIGNNDFSNWTQY